MKAILTITAVFFLGAFTVVHTAKKVTKVETITESHVLVKNLKQTVVDDTKVLAVYMFKNSRVKKELAFKTKRNRSKISVIMIVLVTLLSVFSISIYVLGTIVQKKKLVRIPVKRKQLKERRF